MDAPGFLTGQMLIAMPGIGDPRFERALLLVCAHDATHAMALAVNRPLDGVTVPELLRRLDIGAGGSLSDDPVLLGGPVERERGFVVHTADYEARDDNTLRISDNLALTATRDVLEALVSPQGRPRRARLALGYAGWGAGQLEQEIRQNVWLTCEADEDLVFGLDHDGKWARALGKLGVDPRLLSAAAGRA